jgi:hypothetical protein
LLRCPPSSSSLPPSLPPSLSPRPSYLASAGVGWREADFKWLCTADGDWIVLLLQTARFLIKSLGAAREGKPLSGLCACLEPLRDAAWRPTSRAARTVDDFLDLPWLIERFELRSLTQIVSAGEKLAGLQVSVGVRACTERVWSSSVLKAAARSSDSHTPRSRRCRLLPPPIFYHSALARSAMASRTTKRGTRLRCASWPRRSRTATSSFSPSLLRSAFFPAPPPTHTRARARKRAHALSDRLVCSVSPAFILPSCPRVLS